MMAKLSSSGRIILWFLLVSTVLTLIDALDHNCQQQLDTITGETEGKIITRRPSQIYYGNNYDCKWLIDAGEGKKVKLTVLSTNLEWAPTYTTCSQYDNLKIIEGNSESGEVITAICGDRNPYHVISQGQYLFLTFKTTHQNFNNWKGVELHFEVFDNNTCPPSWFASGDWCISVNQGRAQWLDSQTICSYSRANLASITSAEEFQLIYDNGVNVTTGAWIGLHDKMKEGLFAWIDRQQYDFQRTFSKSKPNNDQYDCVAQSFTGGASGGEWVVEKCDTELNYICKARKDGTTKIYNAVQSSDSPEAGGDVDRINYRIIIIIVVAVVIVGLVIVLCLCRRRRINKRRKLKKALKQEQTTYRESSQELDRLNPLIQDSRATPNPSAPPAEPVMVYDTQLVAPPTYEESQHHPIAPADY